MKTNIEFKDWDSNKKTTITVSKTVATAIITMLTELAKNNSDITWSTSTIESGD